MVNSAFNFCTSAGDFGFQRPDARFQFRNGQGTQILSEQLGQRIIGLSRQIIVHVHKG
jgi:hypothetical protein